MMNCGYDPAPGGKYDLPPIAPQMWHAYHIAGEQMSMAILAALMHRHRTGKGQHVSCAIHEAVVQVHRGRPDDLGHAARARFPPDLPARARERVSASDDRAYQGRPLGDGEPRQSAATTARS